MDWFVESHDAELLAVDLTEEEAMFLVMGLAIARDEPVSAQSIITGEEIVVSILAANLKVILSSIVELMSRLEKESLPATLESSK